MTDTGLHNEGAGMPRARFVAFAVNGRQGYGLLRDDGLAYLSRRLADTAPTLQSLIASGAWDAAEQAGRADGPDLRSEEHTSELHSLMRNSYAVFCFKKKTCIDSARRTEQ